MKTIVKFILPACLLLLAIACDDMYSMIKDDLDKGETVYTGVVDSVKYYPGNSRVRFTWEINADPRISKTVIYWNSGNDSVSVPANRTQTGVLQMEKEINLPEGAYTFEFVTMDDYGNRSLGVEKSVEIYGERYGSLLPVRSIRSMVVSEGPELNLVWSNPESSDVIYTTLEYTDHSVNPAVKKTVRIENSVVDTVLKGIRLEPFTVVTTYHPAGGLDNVNTQTRSYIPYVAEKDILIINGLTEYTATNADAIRKLVYPMYASSFRDLFYFRNLTELDLVGDNVPLPKLSYTKIYSAEEIYDEVGGGAWVPFMRKAGDISAENRQIILNLLASGQLTKVRYVPNSLGLAMDSDLAPYVGTGKVELMSLPAEVLVPNQFQADGRLEAINFGINITYPATDAPAGTGLQNIYKLTVVAKDGSLFFALPTEFQFNIREYPYLKYKIYTPEADLLTDNYRIFRNIYLRTMNRLWGFSGNSAFGQELYTYPRGSFSISEENLHKWTDVTANLAPILNLHNRVLLFTIGEESGSSGPFPPEIDRTFYFANIRFSKNP